MAIEDLTKNCFRQVEKTDGDKNWLQILAIIIACLVPLTGGIIFAWPSPFILVITKDKEKYDITEYEASFFPVLPSIGLIAGSLVFYKLNDIIGRKRTFLFAAIPQIVFWIMTMFARDVITFYIARLISGLADAAVFTSLPMYMGEISTPEVRGSWGNALAVAVCSGIFLINVAGSFCGVQETAYIFICIPILFVLLFYFMPESPYFYIMKGKEELAKQSLKRLRRKENIEEDFKTMKEDVERQMSESGTWKDLFTINSNRKALGAGAFLRVSQQFGGIAVLGTYTQLIFEKSGGNIGPEASAMIFSGLCAILSVCGSMVLDKLGRIRALVSSCLICGCVLLIESIYFYFDQFGHMDVSSFNWIPITGMIIYIVFHSFGLGIVPTLMLGELFSASVKVKALCVMNVVFGIAVCLTTSLFSVLNTYVGFYSPFLCFSLCCFVSSVLTLHIVPETTGKTLEQIQQSLKDSLKEREIKSNLL